MSIKNDSFLSRKSSKLQNTVVNSTNTRNPQTQNRFSYTKNAAQSSRKYLQGSLSGRSHRLSQKTVIIQKFNLNQSQVLNYQQRPGACSKNSTQKLKSSQLNGQHEQISNLKQFNNTLTIDQDSKDLPTYTAFQFISQNKKYRQIFDSFQKNNKILLSTLKDLKQNQEYDKIKEFISKQLYIQQNQREFKDKFQLTAKNMNQNKNSIQKDNDNDGFSDTQNGKEAITNNSRQQASDNRKSNRRFFINNSKEKTITIQPTSLEKEKIKKNIFFSDHRKVINLQQKCMLLEYYYKDQEKRKLDISYLRKLTSSSAAASSSNTTSSFRHRRLSNKSSTIEKAYMLHNPLQIQRIKKNLYVREDKADLQAIKNAKKNYTFKRQRNFKQMEQIIKENHEHLMLEQQSQNDLSLYHPSQKQKKGNDIFLLNYNKFKANFNKFMKIFMKFAVINQILRHYFNIIDEEGITKLKLFLLEVEQKLSNILIQNIIRKILKYKCKNDKTMKLYDFLELIVELDNFLIQKINKQVDTINADVNVNIKHNKKKQCLLRKIQKKHPQIFEKTQQKVIVKNRKQIDTYLNDNNLKVVLKLLFNSHASLTQNNKKFIPVKHIPNIFQQFCLISNQLSITISKIYEFSMWNQNHKEGINFDEFCESVLMMCIRDGKRWKEGTKDFFEVVKKQIHL